MKTVRIFIQTIVAFLLFTLNSTVSAGTNEQWRTVDSTFDAFWGDMALDTQGNLLITGVAYTTQYVSGREWITVKYDPAGNRLWARFYSGGGTAPGGIDVPSAIAVDKENNVYVFGSCHGSSGDEFCTIKYDSEGKMLWVRREGNDVISSGYYGDIVLDKDANVYVTGTNNLFSSSDFYTIKYDKNGNKKWEKTYNGTGYLSQASLKAAVDDNENIIVTGYSRNTYGTNEVCTIKYDSSGSQKWVARNGDYASDVAHQKNLVNKSGEIYVTGASTIFGNNYDLMIKYDASGHELWSKQLYGSFADAGLDYAGNIYYTGSGGTIKLDADGNQLWLKESFKYAANGGFAQSIALDSCGNVYVTGFDRPLPNPDIVFFGTIKYNTAGDSLWSTDYGPAGDALQIIADGRGGIYVAGTTTPGSGQNQDVPIVKYGPDTSSLSTDFSYTSDCTHPEVQFTNLSSADASRWQWYFGDGGAGNSENPAHTFNTGGTYTVTLGISNADCSNGGVAVKSILFEGGSGIGTVPNTFTPNGDGSNDTFNFAITGTAVDYSIKIYNRWGEEMYHASDPKEFWHGTYKGKIVAQGVYYYVLQSADCSGNVLKTEGPVTVFY